MNPENLPKKLPKAMEGKEITEKIYKGMPIWHERMKEYEQNRKNFLQWIKNTYSPIKVYYPGSGIDKIPKEVLGEDKVIHLSLEENKEVGGYFSRLGPGNKIEGDFLNSPFKDKSFDAIVIHDTPEVVTRQALDEFHRVLEDNKILILDNGNWQQKALEEFLVAVQKKFDKQPLPSQFNNPDNTLMILRDAPGSIITSEKELEKRLDNIPSSQQSVIKQYFAVFKKKLNKQKNDILKNQNS